MRQRCRGVIENTADLSNFELQRKYMGRVGDGEQGDRH